MRLVLIAGFSLALIVGLIWGPSAVHTLMDQHAAAIQRETEEKCAEIRRLRQSGGADAIHRLHAYLDNDDARVRADAVTAIGHLALQAELNCPISVVSALLDHDRRVRDPAGFLVTAFKAYEGDPTAALIRAAKHEDRDTRAAAVTALAKQPSRSDDVIAAITLATTDPDLLVRHNAFVAHYRATDDIRPIGDWCVRILAGVDVPETDSRVLLEATRDSARRLLEELRQRDPRTFESHLLELADRDSGAISATAQSLLDDFAEDHR